MAATVWRRRQRSSPLPSIASCSCWLILLVQLQSLRPCSAGTAIQTTSMVLEEVLEHGPLFDELEDEAWWSGVDVIDTALRSWPEAAPSVADPSGLAVTAPPMDEEDFCRFWNVAGQEPGGQLVPADACLLMSRASMAVDLGSSQMLLLPRLPPPPPVPPTLTELVNQLNQLSQLQQQVQSPNGGNNDNECLLCQWATLNGTIDLLPNSELSSENTWVPMLVVVALVSAMLGAVLMITALKCRRFKVLPRGGSCPTLPVGYMVGEGKEGVVQTSTELTGMDTLPKNYAVRHQQQSNDGTMTSTLGRPRLETPTMNGVSDLGVIGHQPQIQQQKSQVKPSETATGWRVKLWRKMTGASDSNEQDYCQNPYMTGMDHPDDISAVYAELNSVAGSTVHRPSPIYHLNTYSEIREPHHMPPPPAHPHQQSHHAATLHLRRLLSDGTYENAGYALERGVILMEHDAVSSNCSASTPSSAYYSDLSNSDRSGSLHHQHQLWQAGNNQHAQQCRPRPRVGSESHGSSHSLPPHQHCCHHHHHLHHHHQHSRSLQEQQMIRARDLMPVALQVIPDNQQVPVHYLPAEAAHHLLAFSRGGVSSSMRDESATGSCKRPLPPLPSRQQQRPQRRYAYAVDHQATPGHESPHPASIGGGESPALSCVPSEYV